MSENSNILKLIEADRKDEAIALLTQGVSLVGAIGPRSARAALEVAARFYSGDLMATIYFMNRQHPWLAGQTPIERAEESEEGLEFVIDMIGAIEAGVYI
jgi:uncharacterized protein (DUF2384 family)